MPRRAKQEKQAATVQLPRRAEQSEWPGLTLEAVLYGALLLAAAFIRFYDLGRWPLLTEEATQALAAWRFLHGQPVGSGAVPFLFGGALASFFAFGANDAVARLVPAALGTALVLLPVAFRRRLGTWGALAASFALAFSPTLVFYSRTLAGAVPALAGLGAVLLAVDLAQREQLQQAKVAAVAGLAVALTSSPHVYTFLLVGLLFLGLGWAAKRRDAPWPGWDAGEQKLRALASDRRAWAGMVAALVPLSTAFLLRLNGLQATANLLGSWLGQIVPGSAGRWWSYPLLILAFYESGVLVLGLVGLAAGIRRGNLWAGFLGGWALLGLVLAALSGARDAAATAFTVLPFSLLAGMAVTETIGRLRPVRWVQVGCYVGVISAGLGFWWLDLASAVNPSLQGTHTSYAVKMPEFLRGTYSVVDVVAIVTPLFLLAIVLVLWYWFGREETAWALAVVGFGLVGALLVRNCVSLNLVYARDAREPILVAPSSPDLKDMVVFLEDWSVRRALDQHALSIAAEDGLEPLVPWYLKDFAFLHLLASPSSGVDAGAVVVSSRDESRLLSGFARTRYRLRTVSDTPLGNWRQALGWWMLREGGGPVRADSIELWVQP